jgi:CCR4-NOT transcriptional complex subunit CAF120
MSQFSAGSKANSPSSSPPNDSPLTSPPKGQKNAFVNHQRVPSRPLTPPSNLDYGTPLSTSPNSNNSTPNHQRSSSRPLSMVMPFIPPSMDVNEDTIPELQPIFSLLNTQQNKFYHEGYFLKLDDQSTRTFPPSATSRTVVPTPPTTQHRRIFSFSLCSLVQSHRPPPHPFF